MSGEPTPAWTALAATANALTSARTGDPVTGLFGTRANLAKFCNIIVALDLREARTQVAVTGLQRILDRLAHIQPYSGKDRLDEMARSHLVTTVPWIFGLSLAEGEHRCHAVSSKRIFLIALSRELSDLVARSGPIGAPGGDLTTGSSLLAELRPTLAIRACGWALDDMLVRDRNAAARWREQVIALRHRIGDPVLSPRFYPDVDEVGQLIRRVASLVVAVGKGSSTLEV